MINMATVEAGHLTREIAQEGYAQNTGKAELLPRLHGIGSHLVHRELNNLEEKLFSTQGRHRSPTFGPVLPLQISGPQGVPEKDLRSKKECTCGLRDLAYGHILRH